MLNRLQYWPVALLVRLIGVLPRPLAHAVGIMIGGAVYYLHPRLRRVGLRNLELAFPNKTLAERRKILRGVYVSLGRLLGFPQACRRERQWLSVHQTAAGEPPSLAMRCATARGSYSHRQRSFIFALFGSLGEPEVRPNPYRTSN